MSLSRGQRRNSFAGEHESPNVPKQGSDGAWSLGEKMYHFNFLRRSMCWNVKLKLPINNMSTAPTNLGKQSREALGLWWQIFF